MIGIILRIPDMLCVKFNSPAKGSIFKKSAAVRMSLTTDIFVLRTENKQIIIIFIFIVKKLYLT
jgi:hypothetical protein